MSDRPTEVADGVFQLGTRWVNFHLVTENRDAILVDAGYPGYAGRLDAALGSLGRRLSDITAVIVTHHHVDHAGTAEHVRSAGGSRPPARRRDLARRATIPPACRLLSPSVAPQHAALPRSHRASGWCALPAVTRRPHARRGSDARSSRPPTRHRDARPHRRHCSVLLADRGVLLAGDAMVHFDYATGAAALNLHRFNEDRQQALRSLERFGDVEADTVLFGHGEAWRSGLNAALIAVRGAAGPQ